MSDLDRTIRTLVVELIESSPQPRPASTIGLARPRSPVTLRAGLARMALVAFLVLAAGVAGALIGRNLLPPQDVTADLPMVEGTLAVEPEFSTTGLGIETPLLASGGGFEPVVERDNLDGGVIAVGRIDDADVEVYTWMMLNPPGNCVAIVSLGAAESVCSSPQEPTGGTVLPPWSVTRMGPDDGEPLDVITVWRVPEATSVVVVEAADGARVWQRPVSGIAAFAFDPDVALVTLEALSSDGSSLGETGISPNQLGNPGATPEPGLEGAEEDFVELTGSHPVNLLLADGLTSQDSFADAARAEGLNFLCASGGGLAEWQVCLVAIEGVLAVVPFNGEPGLGARISHPGLRGDVVIPLDTDQPVGVRYTGPQASVSIEYFGESFGEVTAPAPDAG